MATAPGRPEYANAKPVILHRGDRRPAPRAARRAGRENLSGGSPDRHQQGQQDGQARGRQLRTVSQDRRVTAISRAVNAADFLLKADDPGTWR
jgi:hypothetical protein